MAVLIVKCEGGRSIGGVGMVVVVASVVIVVVVVEGVVKVR